jgi:S-DNA-T family DNA segregation ATPase FtsK/SpoIIIE
MADGMKRGVRRKRRTPDAPGFRSEALGVLVLFVALFLLLALLSYSPTDPPAFDSAGGPPQNWMGPVGARTAYAVVHLFGRLPPLLTIMVLFLWGWRLLRQTVDRGVMVASVRLLGIQFFLSVLLAFPHYLNSDISYDLAGTIAGSTAGLLVTHTGLVGAPLIWLVLLLLFLMTAFGLRPSRIAAGLAATGGALVAAGRILVHLFGRLGAGAYAAVRWVLARLAGIRWPHRLRRVPMAEEALAPPAGPTVEEPTRPAETTLAGPTGPSAAEKRSVAETGEPGPALPEPPLPPPPPPPRDADAYTAPPLDIFALPTAEEMGPDEETLRQEATLLQEKLLSFGVQAEVTGWQTGPVITRFEVKPASGVKVNQIVNLADDLALAMRAKRIRIVAPIPGKAAVGVEIPNPKPRIVRLREILESPSFAAADFRLPIALGNTINGEPFTVDLGSMPHLLIAGTTGSGKSVCINVLIASLLYRMGPERCRLILVDPKMLELGIYNRIPHLITPVVIDPKKAVDALRWAVLEMEERFDLLARFMCRDLDQFNAKVNRLRAEAEEMEEETQDIPSSLPYLVIVIDELADLMMTSSADIETLIQRIAQKARAVGLHLVLATQRPSVDVITGPIKANFSSRIAFQVPSKTDSRTILDVNGAEKLLGKGDMLYTNPSFVEPQRIHGAFLSNEEIERLVNFVGGQKLETEEMDIFAPQELEGGVMGAAGERLDEQLREAAIVVVTHDQGSISLIQRRLGVGYTRAARMMDQLEMLGVVGPPDGTKAREVLLTQEQLDDLPWGGKR